MTIDIIALVLSLIALVFSYTSVVFGKNLEIKAKKFDELFLNELKSKFSQLDSLFDKNSTDTLSRHLTFFTDVYVDITLYIIAAKNYFPGINIDKIQDELSEFSDSLYEQPMLMISEVKSTYQIHKLKAMCLIYDQSINHVSNWWIFGGRKIRITSN